MCLSIYGHGPEVKIATADNHYVVWKRLRPSYGLSLSGWIGNSPYQRARYIDGKLVKARLSLRRNGAAGEWVVEAGLHALRTPTSIFWITDDTEIFPAIIPRGAKLYYGDMDDVVSNKLIVFKDKHSLLKWAEKN